MISNPIHNSLYIATIGLVVLCSGCSSQLPNSVKVDSQDEAAAVLFSVTNVAPWSQMADAMKPNFALTGDQAVGKVLPISSRIQQQILDAAAYSLAIGLPQTALQTSVGNAASSTSNTAISNGASTANSNTSNSASSSNTKNTTPGTPPTLPTGTPAGAQLPPVFANNGDVAVDPTLLYQTGLSLFQAVQIMNKEAENAIIASCYVPFLVVSKLTVENYRPQLGYTLHTRLSFFDGELADTNPPDPNKYDPCNQRGLPKVVPILATDNLERALATRSLEVARQVAGALSGMFNGIAGQASANSLNQEINAVLASDYNSRLTVGRESDNTLRIRVGTTDQSVQGGALVAQTYNISLLLLIPRGNFKAKLADHELDSSAAVMGTDVKSQTSGPQLDVYNYTQFLDADTGEILARRPNQAFLQQVDSVMEDFFLGTGNYKSMDEWMDLSCDQREAFGRFLSNVPKGGYNKLHFFSDLLDKDKPNCNADERYKPFEQACRVIKSAKLSPALDKSLWTRANVLISDTLFRAQSVELRLPKPLNIPDQTALIVDDGASSVAQLVGVSGDSVTGVTASLRVAGHTLAPQIALDNSSNILLLTFPSLAAAGINHQQFQNAQLCVTQHPPGGEDIYVPFGTKCFPLLYPDTAKDKAISGGGKSKTPQPNFSLSNQAAQIVADHLGNGSLAIAVNNLKDDYIVFNVSGAQLVSVLDSSGNSLTQSKSGSFILAKAAFGWPNQVVFKFSNITKGNKITIIATGNKGGALVAATGDKPAILKGGKNTGQIVLDPISTARG